ncbi:MAG TPA: TorF family putative porin [Steroidobacteraceae bacterium]|nr:TorF family putative porin [Steroidobacteraceae bacterium]
MRKVRILAALGLLAAATAANAEISSTWTLTNDYDFRGASQSATDPAVQASLDFATDSGFYIGAWASNVDFGHDVGIDYEVDLYTGFSGGAEDGLGWDVGLVYYAYPDDSDANYPEIYGKLSYGMFSGALFYSNDFVNSSQSAMYVSGDVNVPLQSNFSLHAHAGYSFGDFWDGQGGVPSSDYIDWSAGVGYTAGNFELALKWVDTTLDEGDFWFSGEDVNNTEGRVIFTISTTFPWKKE